MAPKLGGLSKAQPQFTPYLDEHDEDEHEHDFGAFGGLGGLGGAAGRGGLGGLGGLGAAGGRGRGRGRESFGLGGIGNVAKPGKGLGSLGQGPSGISRGIGSLSLSSSGPKTAVPVELYNEQIKALQDLTKTVNYIADRTIEGFKEVAAKMHEPKADKTDVKESVDLLVNSISEHIMNRPDRTYLLIPGHTNTNNVDVDTIHGMLADKSHGTTVVGSLRSLVEAVNDSVNEDEEEGEEEEEEEEEE